MFFLSRLFLCSRSDASYVTHGRARLIAETRYLNVVILDVLNLYILKIRVTSNIAGKIQW